MDITTRRQIAATILSQLGGNQFIGMTGARNLTCLEDGSLVFKISGTMTRDRVNRVQITLDPSDTYTMQFHRVRMGKNPSCKLIHERTNLYDDTLRPVFEEITGLVTHFPSIRSA